MPDQNNRDQYDIRTERRRQAGGRTIRPEEIPRADDLLGQYPAIIEGAYGQAGDLFDELYPDQPSHLSPSEREELLRLSGRFQSLTSERRRPRPIGSRPTSEFHLDVSGLHSGVIDLVQGIGDARRRTELFGDPDEQERIQGEIEQTEQRINDLKEQAEAIRGGEHAPDRFRFASPEVTREDAVAEAMEEEAERLQADKEALESTLQQYRGVAPRLGELEMRAEEGEQADAFRDQFIQTFGNNIYENVTREIQRASQARSGQVRTQIEQAELTRREKIRQQGQTERARIDANQSARADRSGRGRARIVPPGYNTTYVGKYLDGYREQRSETLERLTQELTEAAGVRSRRHLPMDQRRLLAGIEVEIEILDHIERSRLYWQTMEEEEDLSEDMIPEAHFPTESQIGMIDEMKQRGIPPDLINAWKWYNRIDFNKPPQVPGEAFDPASSAGDFSVPGAQTESSEADDGDDDE